MAGVPIHSLRKDGVRAKPIVILGGDSEQLVLSHAVSSHRDFSAGTLRSIEFAAKPNALPVGLENVLG